jgi:hypothetical protein
VIRITETRNFSIPSIPVHIRTVYKRQYSADTPLGRLLQEAKAVCLVSRALSVEQKFEPKVQVAEPQTEYASLQWAETQARLASAGAYLRSARTSASLCGVNKFFH